MLTLAGASKRYGDIVALQDANFTVEPGRMLGFLGPNGAGKTTAMRAIFGLVRLDAGQVTWNGRPIDLEDLLRFGYMPEERGLYPKIRSATSSATSPDCTVSPHRLPPPPPISGLANLASAIAPATN